MLIDQLALPFLVVIAATLLVLLALALVWRGRRRQTEPDRPPQVTQSEGVAGASPRLLTSAPALPPQLYQRVVRVASLVFILAAMVEVQLTATGPVSAIMVFLVAGAIAVVLSQEILPVRRLGRWRLPIEAGAAIVFMTVLLVLTGGNTSPFFFGYILLVGAATLWASGFGALLLAVTTSLAYLIAVLVPLNSAPSTSADIARISFNLIALALVAYVCAIVGREQRRAREEALRLSRYDSLTGLHSRDFFLAEMEQEILRAGRSGRPFALLMFDLDGLKAANDRFGHASGDSLLRAVADALGGAIRATDIAARWGGDEFVLLLPETDLTGAMLVADKVRIDIGRLALPNDGLVIRTSASIGLVTYPEDGKSSTELMRRADLAMYEAKRRGRDQVVRFAREAKHDGAPPTTKPAGVADASLATSNGTAGPLPGMPAPAVVVAREGATPPNVGSAVTPVGVPVMAAPAPPAEPSAVPPPSVGRAPWESSGN